MITQKTKFSIGSQVFFTGLKGFEPKDHDSLYIMNDFNLPGTNTIRVHEGKEDKLLFRDMDKRGFIDDTLNSNLPMKAGKFLVPEFNEYIGFTIEDLKSIRHIFENIDDKHKYELDICDAYIENNSFTLTEKQRQKAFETYKKYRN